MTSGATAQPNHPPEWHGRPLYGYDSPAVQQRYIAREAASVADFFLPHVQSGMTLLDCGCGPGALTLGLAEAVAPGQVIGIDLEPRMVEQAIALATERHVANVRFQVANISALPFPERIRTPNALFSPRRRRLAGDLGRRAACRVPVRRCWAQGAGHSIYPP